MRRVKRVMITAGLATGLLATAHAVAPDAHADPNSYFLSCLSSHGVHGYSTAAAIDVGRRIQNDEADGLPREKIIRNLMVNYGTTRSVAEVYIDCAYWTGGGG
jgi:hypothetical protein